MKDWKTVLQEECDRTSQAAVARRLRLSASTVNQVLRGKYQGAHANIETRVRGELMNETVPCPVLGSISKRRCLDEQQRGFAATNHMRVALYRACRNGCANRRES